MQTIHINDVFAKNSRMRKKSPIWKKYLFLQMGYTKKSELLINTFCAEYRHKILNVCAKVCIKTRPKKHINAKKFIT